MSEHRDVAFEALRRYDVSPLRVRLAAESFNSVFRVTTASAVYALRVGAVPQIHPEGTAAVEAAWHRGLRQQRVCVPDVLPNAEGELATLVTDGRAEREPRVCILFDWVAGRSLRTCLTERRSAALGRQAVGPAAAGRRPFSGDTITFCGDRSPCTRCTRCGGFCQGESSTDCARACASMNKVPNPNCDPASDNCSGSRQYRTRSAWSTSPAPGGDHVPHGQYDFW